jgi:S1-C subfamily serine protease
VARDESLRRDVLQPNAASTKPFPLRTTFGVSLMADGDDYTHFSVAGVRKGSPADSAGFLKGDVIAGFDGKPASAWRLATLRNALMEEGSPHRAEVQRGSGVSVPIEFTVHLVSIEDR